jgi:hypothetical protein
VGRRLGLVGRGGVPYRVEVGEGHRLMSMASLSVSLPQVGEVRRTAEEIGGRGGGALLEGLVSSRRDADDDPLTRSGAADVLEGRALGDA